MQSDTAVTREDLDRLRPVDGEAWRQMLDTSAALTAPVVLRDSADDITALLHVLPHGYQVHRTDLSALLPSPARKVGATAVRDADSFVRFVGRHAEPGTTLYAHKDHGTITAVLNAHTEDAPGWSDHTAVLTLRQTPEWKRWAGISGQWLSQDDFAEHVEDSSADFRSPSAASMLEIAQTFEAKMGADFEQGVRLDNGQRQLVYKETVSARAGQKGSLEIPSILALGLRPYEGGPGYNVDVRLRYKITNANLSLMVKIDRLDDVVELAFAETVAKVTEALSEVSDLLLVHGVRATR